MAFRLYRCADRATGRTAPASSAPDTATGDDRSAKQTTRAALFRHDPAARKLHPPAAPGSSREDAEWHPHQTANAPSGYRVLPASLARHGETRNPPAVPAPMGPPPPARTSAQDRNGSLSRSAHSAVHAEIRARCTPPARHESASVQPPSPDAPRRHHDWPLSDSYGSAYALNRHRYRAVRQRSRTEVAARQTAGLSGSRPPARSAPSPARSSAGYASWRNVGDGGRSAPAGVQVASARPV